MVHGKNALFHRWEDISQPRDAVLQGTVSGFVRETVAIVEYEDGTVAEIHPCDIVFIDRYAQQFCFNRPPADGEEGSR